MPFCSREMMAVNRALATTFAAPSSGGIDIMSNGEELSALGSMPSEKALDSLTKPSGAWD